MEVLVAVVDAFAVGGNDDIDVAVILTVRTYSDVLNAQEGDSDFDDPGKVAGDNEVIDCVNLARHRFAVAIKEVCDLADELTHFHICYGNVEFVFASHVGQHSDFIFDV